MASNCCTYCCTRACKRLVPRSELAVDLGALGGTRTPNLLIRSQMLYPLSYERWLMPLACGDPLPHRQQGRRDGRTASDSAQLVYGTRRAHRLGQRVPALR
jgi:hypothetical protein